METYNSIELTKQLVKDGKISQEIAETIFPELKESEDERIRKELLNAFQKSEDTLYMVLTPHRRESFIAWLEKQGEKEYALKSSKDVDVHKFVQYIERQAKAYELNLPNRSYDIYGFAKDILSWLEKQGSQNLANSEKTCKVEPKFKVGDWVVYNDDICQIVKREEGCNKLVTNFGIEKELVNERNLSTARLWTIQDAKDGDVLANNGNIILFKQISDSARPDYKFIQSYCFILVHSSDFYLRGTYNLDDGFHPATKEQRDLLFRKMKEAGYEWDVEKKELRKIEQNPACKERVQPQHQQEWSEDDEDALRVVTNIFEKYGVKLLCYPAFVHWLKTLPNRITFNPYWKPSDEQMEYLAKAITTLGNEGDNKTSAILCELRADLKKLKG